jgi:hypothetical protein
VTLADLIQALDGETVAALADRLMPEITARLAGRLPAAAAEPDGWLDTKGAAEYLGPSRASMRCVPLSLEKWRRAVAAAGAVAQEG